MPHFWRAPTDNDIGTSLQMRSAAWRDAELFSKLDTIIFSQDEGSYFTIKTIHHLLTVDAIYITDYLITKDGSVKIKASMKAGNKSLPELPRFGMKLILKKDFDQVSWFGRGPFDNYWDRKYSADIDQYKMPVDSMFHPYAREPTISTGVLHFDMRKLDFDRYAKENNHGGSMKNEDLIWWNIDYKQMGVGGDNSWGAKTHLEYTLPYQDYQYTFTLKPIYHN